MSHNQRFSSAGERPDPSPLGRGCFPLTVMIGLTLVLTGAIGWAIGDWVGLGIGVVIGLAGWSHLIWS